VRFKEKRAITWEEHQAIVGRESNAERRAFYELCWHLGGAQSDVAGLTAEDIDWQTKVVSFRRKKTGTVSIIRFGAEVEKVLASLPCRGPLFPKLREMREAHRATEFRRVCRRVGVSGVTLHSYRYSWAERAKVCGYPERFAQEALGHNSKAVHRSYARKAQVIIPTLEDFERYCFGKHAGDVKTPRAPERGAGTPIRPG
jgi:integrase